MEQPAVRTLVAFKNTATSVMVPATTANLGPGFDALGMALGIFNRVDVTVLDQHDQQVEGGAGGPPDGPAGPVDIDVQGEGRDTLDRGPANLVYFVLRRAFARAGVDPESLPPMRIGLVNRIPLSRGLGSSAAAIVGGLVAANCLLGKPFGLADILEEATEIEGHPDNVAAALFGGVVASGRRDGRLTAVPIQVGGNVDVALAIPSSSLPTSVARSVLPGTIPFADAVFNVGQVALLVASLASGDWGAAGKFMRDRLHQPYRRSLVPGLAEALDAALSAGAHGAALSGSGPTAMAVCPAGTGGRVAGAMCDAFKAVGVAARPVVTRPTNVGVRECE